MRKRLSDCVNLTAEALTNFAERLCLCLAVPLYSMFRALIPTKSNLVAFMSVPDFSDNALALFETMHQAEGAESIQFAWIVKHPPAVIPNFIGGNVRWVKKNTSAGLICFLRSRLVFFTHGTYRFVRVGWHQTLVNLWHGMPIKKIGTFLDHRVFLEPPFSHWTIATSKYFCRVLASAFEIPYDRVIDSGLPRNEWLFMPDSKHLKLRGENDALVVWLPTYREYDLDGYKLQDASEMDQICPLSLAEIDNALEGLGVKVFLKFHPADARNHQKWPGLKNITVQTSREFQGAGLNIYKLLACADALVTDFSSIAIDYLITGKPIVLFGADEATYSRGVFPLVFERLSQVSFKADNISDLIGLLCELPKDVRDFDASEFLHQRELIHPSLTILNVVGSPLVLHQKDGGMELREVGEAIGSAQIVN